MLNIINFINELRQVIGFYLKKAEKKDYKAIKNSYKYINAIRCSRSLMERD